MSRRLATMTAFALRTEDAPYTSRHEWLSETAAFVFPVTPKVMFATARRGAYVHRMAAAAATCDKGEITYGARWACGGGSPDAVFLAEIGSQILCGECLRRPEPTVYRFYDSADRLLYVGCSGNPSSRLRQHKVLQPWWEGVERTTFETFPTIPDALSAEFKAIVREQPAHNDDRRVRSLTAA